MEFGKDMVDVVDMDERGEANDLDIFNLFLLIFKRLGSCDLLFVLTVLCCIMSFL